MGLLKEGEPVASPNQLFFEKEVRMARRTEDTRLLDVWQGAGEDGDEGMRRLLETVVRQVMGEELTAFLGAENYERTGDRQGYRNGYMPRQL